MPPRHFDEHILRDQRIAHAASNKRGLVTTDELRRLGLSSSTISEWCRRGRLHRIHHGVYAVGHAALDFRARVLAATLAVPGSAASGACATRLHGIFTRGRPYVQIVAPRRQRPLRDVVTTYSSTLIPSDITSIDGIPCTSPSRSIAELADTASAFEVANAMYEARRIRAVSLTDLIRAERRFVTRRSHRVLAKALRLHRSDSAGTMSNAEERLRRAFADRGIPEPLVNVRLRCGRRQVRVDFCWPELALCLELDGPHHAISAQQRTDAMRDQALRRAGFEVIRVPIEFLEGAVDLVAERFRRVPISAGV